MFIVSLTYTCELEKIDEFLEEHKAYLKEQYSRGHFIASGRKVPREGGIILSKIQNVQTLKEILNEDPFKKNNLASYTIQEFIPSMTSHEFSNLKEE